MPRLYRVPCLWYYRSIMPYCPQCGYEYESWVTACPDCGAKLVDALPPPREPDNVPITFLTTAPNEMVANFWKGVLADNGIESLLKSADIRAAMYTLPTNLHYDIYVREPDADKAREVLRPFEEDL